jgi:hypothetical protein
VYLGFAVDDVPAGFGDLVLRRLQLVGHVYEFRRFANTSRAAVVELGRASGPSSWSDRTWTETDLSAGCIGIRPAVRW